MGLCIIVIIVIYFFLPETKRIPMEEIGALFGDKVIVHLTADGHGIKEDSERLPGFDREVQGTALGEKDAVLPAVYKCEAA